MLSHYATFAVLSPDAKELNPIFGPPTESARSQNIHFTFSGALGWKDTANMPGTGSMDGSQSRRWTRRRGGTDARRRERGWEADKQREGRIGWAQGWGSIVNSRVSSSWRCILHSHVCASQGPTMQRERERGEGGERERLEGQMAGESRGLVIIEWAGVVSLRDFMRHRPCMPCPTLLRRAHRHSQKCARVMLWPWTRVPQKCGSFNGGRHRRWFTSCLTLPLCAWIVRLIHFISRTMCEVYWKGKSTRRRERAICERSD